MESLPSAKTAQRPVVLDLGKRKRKQVKLLRKGEGDLMAEIDQAVSDLKASGDLAPDVQTVVVLVREKPKKNESPLVRLLR
jgi:hypothetical protein